MSTSASEITNRTVLEDVWNHSCLKQLGRFSVSHASAIPIAAEGRHHDGIADRQEWRAGNSRHHRNNGANTGEPYLKRTGRALLNPWLRSELLQLEGAGVQVPQLPHQQGRCQVHRQELHCVDGALPRDSQQDREGHSGE